MGVKIFPDGNGIDEQPLLWSRHDCLGIVHEYYRRGSDSDRFRAMPEQIISVPSTVMDSWSFIEKFLAISRWSG